MPHIVIESTPRLSAAIDFVALFSALHRQLAADGHADCGSADYFEIRPDDLFLMTRPR